MQRITIQDNKTHKLLGYFKQLFAMIHNSFLRPPHPLQPDPSHTNSLTHLTLPPPTPPTPLTQTFPPGGRRHQPAPSADSQPTCWSLLCETARSAGWSDSGAGGSQGAESLSRRCNTSRLEASASDGSLGGSDEVRSRQKQLSGKTLSQLLGKGGVSAARRPITDKAPLPPPSLVGR